jgi:hypothetical protein
MPATPTALTSALSSGLPTDVESILLLAAQSLFDAFASASASASASTSEGMRCMAVATPPHSMCCSNGCG